MCADTNCYVYAIKNHQIYAKQNANVICWLVWNTQQYVIDEKHKQVLKTC